MLNSSLAFNLQMRGVEEGLGFLQNTGKAKGSI